MRITFGILFLLIGIASLLAIVAFFIVGYLLGPVFIVLALWLFFDRNFTKRKVATLVSIVVIAIGLSALWVWNERRHVRGLYEQSEREGKRVPQ